MRQACIYIYVLIVQTKRSEVRTEKDQGPIFSQYSLKQVWLIRDLLHDVFWQEDRMGSFGTVPGRILDRRILDLENIGPAIEHSDWLILVIVPLTALVL